MNEWITVTWEGMDWLVRKGYEQSIPYHIWDKVKRPRLFPECQILKDSILRISFLLPFSAKGDQVLFIKRHRPRDRRDDLASLFIPSRAFSEWKILLHFKRLHLPAPQPIAYGEKRHYGILRDSVLVTEAIDNAQSLNRCFPKHGDAPEKKKDLNVTLLSQLAQLIAQLHRKGGYYRDLHGGNILCRNNPGGTTELFFVDTDKVRFVSKMTRSQRIRDLAMLYNSIPWSTPSTWIRFLQAYITGTNNATLHREKFFLEIEETARALRERHLKSRSKRCFKKSTSFGVMKKGKQKRYVRKELPEDILEQVLEIVKNFPCTSQKEPFGGTGNVERFRITLPSSNSYSAFRVRRDHYRWRERVYSLLGFSPGKQAWFNSNGLMVRKILTPKPLALVEEKGVWGVKSSILITEDISFGDPLNFYLLKHFDPKNRNSHFVWKSAFIKCLSRNLNQIYEKNVYFENLKVEEIFVEEVGKKSWRFYFGNVDRIFFNHPVSETQQMRNLLELHTSVPPTLSEKDRLRFLSFLVHPLPPKGKNEFIRNVLAQIT